MSYSMIALCSLLGLYALVATVGAWLWFFIELKHSRRGRIPAAIKESMMFGLMGVPVLIVFAILVNACQFMGFKCGSRALAKMK